MRRASWFSRPIALSPGRLAALSLLLCLFPVSCAELGQIIPQKPSVTAAKFEIEPPKADIKTALRILKTVQTGELDSRLTLTVQNPNSFGLSLGRISYRIYLKDLKALEGILPEGIALVAAGSTPIPMDLKLPLGNIPSIAQALAKNPESVPYKVEGEVSLTGLLSGITVPYSLSGQVGKKKN